MNNNTSYFVYCQSFSVNLYNFVYFYKVGCIFLSSFYENYVKLCNTVRKSPSAVAMEIGMTKTAVSNWKNRGTTPTDANAQIIADYFGITVSELMAENENKPAPEGNELNLESIIKNMSREDLIEFIMLASSRLKDIE